MNAAPRWLISLVVWFLFLAACVSPAVKVDEGGHACTAIRMGTLPGFVTLLLGWISPGIVPWSANLLLLAGWILLLCKKTNGALGLGIAAALLGFTTWAFAFGWEELLVGYYLWQSSLVSFALGVLVIRFWQPAHKIIPWSEAEEWKSKFIEAVSETEQSAVVTRKSLQEK